MKFSQRITEKFSTDNIATRKIERRGETYELIFNPDLTDTQTLRAVVFALCDEKNGGCMSFEDMRTRVLYECETEVSYDVESCTDSLLSGDLILCRDGEEGALIIDARSYETRSIVEPPTETVMRGPREGFIEDIKTNLSLLERRLKTPELAIDRLKIGRRTKTNVAVCYLSSVAQPSVVKKVKKRLNDIDIDGIIDSHYLVPYLEENPMSLFTQVGVSEKPDIVAAKLLEGRVAIVVEGSPMVLTLPFLMVEDFQSGEDYYRRASFATFVRWLRYASLMLATLLPALYVALQNFHYTLIPVRFMTTLISAIKGLPMSPLCETLFVLLLFEIIREASVRMPRAVGIAMSIVGALVLGDTAVKAGIISSPAVMISALSSIALFTVPNLVGSMSVLRLVFTVIGGLTGLFGLTLAVLFVMHYICSINAYDTPYLAPFAPLVYADFKDSIERAPLFDMKRRPRSLPNINDTRQS